MKKSLILSMILAGTMVATTGYSQVYVNAHVGFGFPAPRVYCAPPPPPVVYETPCPPPCYNDYNRHRVVIVDHRYGYYHDRYDYDRNYDRWHERDYRDHERYYDRDHERYHDRHDDHEDHDEHDDHDRR